jgi:hypothetical protein
VLRRKKMCAAMAKTCGKIEGIESKVGKVRVWMVGLSSSESPASDRE